MALIDCPQVNWTEYAKGYFVVSDNKSLLTSVFTDSLFAIKTSDCYNIGTYGSIFNIKHCYEKLVLYHLDPYINQEIFKTVSLNRE